MRTIYRAKILCNPLGKTQAIACAAIWPLFAGRRQRKTERLQEQEDQSAAVDQAV